MYESGFGLAPKSPGTEFRLAVYYGDSGDPERNTYYGDGSTYGESETNAVIKHQRSSTKNPTSGVSTTPKRQAAEEYALYAHPTGYVYKIDTLRLTEYHVTAYEVAEHVTKPSKPGDKEIILVAADWGPLPNEIVIEVIPVPEK